LLKLKNHVILKKIDIYIIKKFLSTFFFSLLLITAIAIVFHFSEHIDEFMENDAPWHGILFDYYLNLVPFYVNLFIFLFTFLSVVYFTSKMAGNTEIIAIRSTGISFLRFLIPYIYCAIFIGILSFILGSYIIPPANTKRLKFEYEYVKKSKKPFYRHIHKQIEPDVFVYMESYRPRSKIAHKFTIERFVEDQLVSKMRADYIKWDTTINKWKAHNYYIRQIFEMHENIEKGKTIDTTFKITPEELEREIDIVETMTLGELNHFIEQQIERGSDAIKFFLVEKYKRTAFPFSTLILTIIGVSISSRRIRGGTGMHIGLGLLVTFSYIFFMQVSFNFSLGGKMDPLLAVWLPNIIFMGVASILYYFAPR
jgi:lipopolysaccharide export system permease protein